MATVVQKVVPTTFEVVDVIVVVVVSVVIFDILKGV